MILPNTVYGKNKLQTTNEIMIRRPGEDKD
jgi:hypothetical protein